MLCFNGFILGNFIVTVISFFDIGILLTCSPEPKSSQSWIGITQICVVVQVSPTLLMVSSSRISWRNHSLCRLFGWHPTYFCTSLVLISDTLIVDQPILFLKLNKWVMLGAGIECLLTIVFLKARRTLDVFTRDYEN